MLRNLFQRAVSRFVIFAAVCVTVLSGTAEKCHGNDPPPAQLKFSIKENQLIYLDVEVFGTSNQFLLDTGAGVSVFDERFRDALGAPIAGGVSEKRSHQKFSCPPMKISNGAIDSPNAGSPIFIRDFAMMRSLADHDIRGILGMDVLREHIVRLNFDEGAGELRRESSLTSGHEERLHFKLFSPGVLIRHPSFGFQRYQINTGASAASLYIERDRFRMLVRKGHIRLLGTSSPAEVLRQVTLRFGVIDYIDFGPHRFFNVRVMEEEANVQGTINLPFLERFDVELDFPNQRGRFRPGQHVDRADDGYCTAFNVKHVGKEIIAIAHRGPDGEALSEIQDGDKLLNVNGTAAVDLGMMEIRKLLCQPDTQLQVLIERDGVARELTLNLPPRIDLFPAKSPHELIDEAGDDFDK